MKVCSKCGINKPLDQFNNEEKKSDGKYPWCKECLSWHKRMRYQKVDRKVWITQKVCSKCKKWKPREEYRKYKGKNLHYRCIECEDRDLILDQKGLSDCSKCSQTKPLEEFYESRKNKTSKQCIDCQKKYYKTRPVGNYFKQRDTSLRKYFGITLEQYKDLLKLQNYTCPICLESFENGKYSYPVDHAHNGPHEGKIRAILHNICNRYIMARHNDPEFLRRAADLMESPLTEWFVPEEYVKSRKSKIKRKKRKT